MRIFFERKKQTRLLCASIFIIFILIHFYRYLNSQSNESHGNLNYYFLVFSEIQKRIGDEKYLHPKAYSVTKIIGRFEPKNWLKFLFRTSSKA